MSEPSIEIAAATLEHSERIRLLTDTMANQRRSIGRLARVIGALVVIQGITTLREVLTDGRARWWADQLRIISFVAFFVLATVGVPELFRVLLHRKQAGD